MRTNLRLLLEKNGFQVVGEAENGEVAIQKYTDLNPDVVTMDITMPVLDGIEAVKGIMQTDPTAKIVMISAMGQQTSVVESIRHGAKAFIVKPFDEDKLISTINSLIK